MISNTTLNTQQFIQQFKKAQDVTQSNEDADPSIGTQISSFASRIFNSFVKPHHDMRIHVFKEATHGAAKLYYQGDIPILELQYDDPYVAGFSQGYLMGKYFEKLLNRMSFLNRVLGNPKPQDIPQTLEAVLKLLPEDYLSELKGMVEGYNQWLKDNSWLTPTDVTIEEVILFHLMPDSLHFSPQDVEVILQGNGTSVPQHAEQTKPIGCTVVIGKDDEKGMTFGRNMDWPSFGFFGTYSLIINRKHPEKKLSTVELGFPGFLGSLTGMNKNGLSAAMNVCSHQTSTVLGLPAVFYNRMCLEKCRTVNDVKTVVNRQSPLGAYHLSLADRMAAHSFHFFQGANGSHVVRDWKNKQPLITTNCQYLSKNGSETGNLHCSVERKQMLNQFFKDAKKKINPGGIHQSELIEASLSLPYVNNDLTTHQVIMYPQSRGIRVAVDNKFAGRLALHNLDTTNMF